MCILERCTGYVVEFNPRKEHSCVYRIHYYHVRKGMIHISITNPTGMVHIHCTSSQQ